MAKNRLIVALDVSEREVVREWAERLAGEVGMIKIGLELFVRYGPGVVEEVQVRGGRVMLDLKLHDIPNTVGRAVRNAALLGVEFLTLHASGGRAMMEAGRRAVKEYEDEAGRSGPKLLAVTVLTSLDERALREEVGVGRGMREQVGKLARLARESGCDGVVASAQEIDVIRGECGWDFLVVTPGIRPRGAGCGDQKRVCTPSEAIGAGAD
ncbi:MAG: orotidine-5'-phosphate decarboxylase, partial [Hydrogenophilus sp.]|nr:orotidine-5'-phosphate decarboxylase [Hydrogenophilus sp.]